MTEEERHFCLWHYLTWLRPAQRKQLYAYFSSPEAAYSASRSELESLGVTASTLKRWQVFARAPMADPALQAVDQRLQQFPDLHFITIGDPRYPELLKETADAPAGLYVRGDVSTLAAPSIAIVGSRRASAVGVRHASGFAAELAGAGFCVVSGGALGIDAAAHRGALRNGRTVAVIATGVDISYPSQHVDLYQQIAEQGAVVSEFRLGTAPKAGHFPRRNRIIAGLCHGTLVIEAALRSGSLITARLANEYNREVFALPGAINDPLAKGTNSLIKAGAKLTEELMDIVDEFPRQHAEQSAATTPLSSELQAVLGLVDFAHTPLEVIAERSDQAVYELLPLLITLETEQLIVADSGGYRRV